MLTISLSFELHALKIFECLVVRKTKHFRRKVIDLSSSFPFGLFCLFVCLFVCLFAAVVFTATTDCYCAWFYSAVAFVCLFVLCC